jgi:branched-chain amino acid uptake carrier
MDKKKLEDKALSLSSYILIGSMLFGLFFGAGNLIFPVHMGQEAGSNMFIAITGFLIVAVGLPFLGVVALGVSKSEGLFDLASRVNPFFGYFMTVLLYLTIGPFFAIPRTATVSFEIGIMPFIGDGNVKLALFIFTILFFSASLFFTLRPGKIVVWVGKILNPIFLIFLGILIIVSLIIPMGDMSAAAPIESYKNTPFLEGILAGYNTMDALAALAFGIIVINTLRSLGIKSSSGIAIGTMKAGSISALLMAIIYTCLAYMGANSVEKIQISENGGQAMSLISGHYFGVLGQVLLAIIITVACLKTAIGLIIACSETFILIFPKSFSFKTYVFIFTAFSCMIANFGLSNIISFSIPVLMFLYPLAIALIMLGLLSPLFKNKQCVYRSTILFTIFISFADGLKAMPEAISGSNLILKLLEVYDYVPFFKIGMGWIVPMFVGGLIGIVISKLGEKNTLHS